MTGSDALKQRVISTRISRNRGAGWTLLDYLAARFTYRDRDGWRERIAAGLAAGGAADLGLTAPEGYEPIAAE